MLNSKILIPITAVVLLSSYHNTIEKDMYSAIDPSATITTMQSELEKSIERGAIIYTDFCKTCHRPKGNGFGKSFPPLAESDYLIKNREGSIRAVKYGQKGEIVVNGKTYNKVMAAMGLEDDEVADVLNYVMNSWGNTQERMITKEEVAAIEKE